MVFSAPSNAGFEPELFFVGEVWAPYDRVYVRDVFVCSVAKAVVTNSPDNQC